jgi:hypothetical protein
VPSTTRVYDMVRAMLDGIVTRWPIDADPLPALQYVANGQVMWDGCEVLAATVERQANTEADVGLEQYNIQGPGLANRFAVVAVLLIRCVPEMTVTMDAVSPPDAADIEASARSHLLDAEALYGAILATHRAGEITSCNGLAYEAWTSDGPQGGFGGGTLRVRVLLI